MTPQLKLGPLLRYVSETEATVWVETDQACEVEVLGHRAETFCVEAHHYALVVITGLEPAGSHEYEVALDGATCWPAADSDLPPSVIRTLGGDDPLDICFGSCRVALPHEGPNIEPKDEGGEGFEFDALRVRMAATRARRSVTGPQRSTRRATAPAGASAGTSAASGRSSWIPGPAGSWSTGVARSWTTSGSGSSTTRPGTSTTC